MKTKQEIFDTLISQDLKMLRSAAFKILGNQADVDEAVQEALLIAWNKFDQFRSGAKLSTWVYRITVNHCCDRLKKKKQENEKLLKYADNQSAGIKENHNPMLDDLAEAVAELPEPYRESILIGFLSGFDGKEAAELIGCSINTLYQRIHRAKEILKTKLEVMA
ncbi:MAG: RNA polymerase sigma factor [Lentisphaeria bacterium]|nr:RNA polymerase sigma factor [Lentisphaeria bacterium]